jgi:hypothetical protein
VRALIIIGTVATEGLHFGDLKSCKLRLVQSKSGFEMCQVGGGNGRDPSGDRLVRTAKRA